MTPEIYLVIMILVIVILGGILYFCCVELEAREKKKFKHTSPFHHELESGTVNGTGVEEERKEPVNRPRKAFKGESFYRGKDTLEKEKPTDENSEDFLSQALYGLTEEEEPEFHLGKDHVLQ